MAKGLAQKVPTVQSGRPDHLPFLALLLCRSIVFRYRRRRHGRDRLKRIKQHAPSQSLLADTAEPCLEHHAAPLLASRLALYEI